MAITKTRHVGSAGSKSGTTLAVTVPSGGIPVGAVLVACADYKWTVDVDVTLTVPGNTVTLPAEAIADASSYIFICKVTSALPGGTSLTLTVPSSGVSKALVIDEYSGASGDHEAAATAAGSGATLVTSGMTTDAGDLLVAGVAVIGTTAPANDSAWTAGTTAGSTGQSTTSNATLITATRMPSATGSFTHATLGVGQPWSAVIVGLKPESVGGDTTPPTINITATSKVTISRVVGEDASDVTFTVNEAYQAYQIRIVPGSSSPVTAGTLVESGSGGIANTSRTVTITDDEFVAAGAIEGNNTVKVFAQDSAGNWSSV